MAAAKDMMKRSQRLFSFVILSSLVIGWAAGMFMHHTSVADVLKETLPGALRFDAGRDEIYTGFNDVQGESNEVGLVARRSAHGYAGPVTVAVGSDTNGTKQIVPGLHLRPNRSF